MEIKASQLATVINEILDGVEGSKCGKIQQGEETILPNGMKDRVLNTLAYFVDQEHTVMYGE